MAGRSDLPVDSLLAGTFQHLVRIDTFENPAIVQDQDLVAKCEEFISIMCDVNKRDAKFVATRCCSPPESVVTLRSSSGAISMTSTTRSIVNSSFSETAGR